MPHLSSMIPRNARKRRSGIAAWLGVFLVSTLATSCCDATAPYEIAPSDFKGVHGQLFRTPGGCDGSDCPAAAGARAQIRALKQTGAVVAETTSADDGSFTLPLATEIYRIELAPSGVPVDRSLVDVAIGDGIGLRIVRTYADEIGPELRLVFATAVSPTRRTEIYADNDLTVKTTSGESVWVLPAPGKHPQLEGERLLLEYPDEITGFSLSTISCLD